jgi:hypothetical protein
MEPTPTPLETLTPAAVTVEGVVGVSISEPISINPDQVYAFLFIFTIYVGIHLVRLMRSLTAPIGLRD